nr:hypothetical protein [Tanacetum cinerariifolium]
CSSDDVNFDLPLIYHVNGHSLHFGRREFCLLTGFELGSISVCEYRNGDIPFCNRLFPEDRVIFLGRELVSVVDDVYLRMVNDLDTWNSFPWGEHIRRKLYDSIRNVSSKHKLEHLAGLKRNPNHVLSYSLIRFLSAFKSLLVYRIADGPMCQKSYREHCHGGERHNLISMSILASFFIRSPPVSIGGLYGEYLNKRSTARAGKKKSSEDFHPRECVREASLIDHVRELECSTSEDELDIKDHTSPKEDDGNVYCCDDNGDVRLIFMPAKPISQQTNQDLSSDLSVLNGFSKLSQTGEEKGDCESIEQMANLKNVLNLIMIENCKSVKPWIEDLSRSFKRIDKPFLSHELQVFFSRAVVGRCKFPWCNDINVDHSFWNGLYAFDDNSKGWLLDEHINIWSCTCGSPDRPVWIGLWLANGIPLALDDPLQSALAYREKLIHFYFKHKMLCP